MPYEEASEGRGRKPPAASPLQLRQSVVDPSITGKKMTGDASTLGLCWPVRPRSEIWIWRGHQHARGAADSNMSSLASGRRKSHAMISSGKATNRVRFWNTTNEITGEDVSKSDGQFVSGQMLIRLRITRKRWEPRFEQEVQGTKIAWRSQQ